MLNNRNICSDPRSCSDEARAFSRTIAAFDRVIEAERASNGTRWLNVSLAQRAASYLGEGNVALAEQELAHLPTQVDKTIATGP